MAASRRWADLPPDLLCRIGDMLDLKCYASARGACTAWRCALAPPSPSLLVVLDDATCCPSASSLLTRRSFELKAVPSGARCVGSSNGWLALSVGGQQGMFSLLNPIAATEIILPPIYGSKLLSKIVFAPSPARDDFAAAAICDVDRLAYVTAGARRWAILDPVRLAAGDHLVDVVYHEKGRVYCLTRYGDVHVLRLPERRRREPLMVDAPSSVPAMPALSSAARCTTLSIWRRAHEQHAMILRRSVGPDLNAPATVEPLLPRLFDAATSFAPPYAKASVFTSAKNLVFCDDNLFQIWRNVSCTVTLQLPGGGHLRVAEDEVFV